MFPIFTTRCLHVRHDVTDPSGGSIKEKNKENISIVVWSFDMLLKHHISMNFV